MGSIKNWKLVALNLDLNETRGGSDENSVFQVIPKFSIEREFAVPFEKGRKIEGIICGSSLAIAVESDLIIFDTGLESVVKNFTFDSSIDFVVWTEKLLVVGLSSSAVVFMNPTTLEQLDTKSADTEADAIAKRTGRFYVAGSIHTQDSTCYLQALTIEGKVYRLSTPLGSDNSLDLTQLEKSVAVTPSTVLTYVMPDVSIGQLITASSFLGPNFLVTADKSGALTILDTGFAAFDLSVCGEDCQYRINNRINLLRDLCLSQDVTIKKVALADGLMFVLLSSGTLEILLDKELFPTERLKLPAPNAVVHDFTIVANDHNVKLWAIFGAMADQDDTSVGLFEGTKFQATLLMRLTLDASTKNSSNSTGKMASSDKIVELKFNQTSSSMVQERPLAVLGVTSTGKTKLFHLFESSTEDTLEQLLSQKKFEQANAFAEKYSKDVDLVRKAKAEALYFELESSADKDIVFSALTETLEEIKDVDFVCGFCARDVPDSFESIDWVKQIFDVGRSKVSLGSGSREHAEKLLLLLKKFHTFEKVFPEGTVNEWKAFCRPESSMFQVCQSFLLNKKFGQCNTVWTRHSEDFVPSLSVSSFVDFFWALFSDQFLSPHSSTFFATILPDALKKFADPDYDIQRGLYGIVGLIKKQLDFLEMSPKWPTNGLRFIETLSQIYEAEAGSLKNSSVNPGEENEQDVMIAVCEHIIEQLGNLKQALLELSELIGSYALRIKFGDFYQDDLESVVNSMLEELFEPEEIVKFVQNFLGPFAMRKELCMDRLFSNHIQSKVGDLIYFQSFTCIPYEKRLICLVGLITDLKTKLQSGLLVVQNLPVPWSKSIQSFVSDLLKSNIPRTTEDFEDCEELLSAIAGVEKQVPFQCLLIKYQLTATGVQSKTGVWAAVKKILTSKRHAEEEKLSDCKELIKFTGKMCYDGVLTLKFRMALDEAEPEVEIEELIPSDLSKSAMERMLERCLSIFPHCFKLQKLYSSEKITRYWEAAAILSRRLNSSSEMEFLKVRKIVPNFDCISKMFHPSYPLNLIEQMIPAMLSDTVTDIKLFANSLSTVCLQPYHELVVAIIFFMLEQASLEDVGLKEKVWTLLADVVNVPGCRLRSVDLSELVFWGVPQLVFQNPDLTPENQKVLEEFLKIILVSFDECPYRLSQLVAIHRIFMTLRAKEIPLEGALFNILTDLILFVSLEVKPVEKLMDELNTMVVGLIKHGEYELIKSVFGFLTAHHSAVRGNSRDEDVKAYCNQALQSIDQLNANLKETIRTSSETETNPRIRELVDALNRAGFHMNAYALRNRNKGRLVNDLLSKKECRLASEVALVFQHRDKAQWSCILKGYINDGNISKLKTLLKVLKNIPELWVLPEFATAWLRVSQEQPEFKNVCPIALL